MTGVRTTPAMLVLAAAAIMAGCHRQVKPQSIVPPPMLPLSAMIPPPEALPPSDAEPIPAQPAPPPVTASKPKPRTRNGKKISDLPKTPVQPPVNAAAQPATTTPVETPTNPPPRISSSARDVPTTAAISDGLPHSDEMHRKQTAAQLNQSTEENLRSITRTLTNTEKSTVEQIRSFIAQSQEAINDNDLVRAHNLAMKAHLLSDELVGH